MSALSAQVSMRPQTAHNDRACSQGPQQHEAVQAAIHMLRHLRQLPDSNEQSPLKGKEIYLDQIRLPHVVHYRYLHGISVIHYHYLHSMIQIFSYELLHGIIRRLSCALFRSMHSIIRMLSCAYCAYWHSISRTCRCTFMVRPRLGIVVANFIDKV